MRLRGGLPLAVFLVLLVAVPVLEVWLIVQVAEQIGVLWTILLLVAEAVLGAWLTRREGRRAWTALSQALTRGTVPSGELADAALVLVGGVLLMLPGFATDVIGFLFLLPLTRPLARRILAFFLARRLSSHLDARVRAAGPAGVVIEGEASDLAPPTGSAAEDRSRPGVARGEIVD